MLLEVGSTERSLSIVRNTGTARESAAEGQGKWQQRNAVEYQPRAQKICETVHHLEKHYVYWYSLKSI